MAFLPAKKRRELGDFLRAHRARLSPASLGLPAFGRRRTPGLRREEVAQACGMSPTWYTWLEQGRDIAASPPALSALARALQLTPAERAYLFELADRRDPHLSGRGGDEGMDVPPALARAIAAIDGPAYLLDSLWNARAWNRPAAALFVGWLDGAHHATGDRNLLRYVFLSPVARKIIPDWQARARRVLAEFQPASRGRRAAGAGRGSTQPKRAVRPVLDRACRGRSHRRRACLPASAPGPPQLPADRLRAGQPARLQAGDAGARNTAQAPAPPLISCYHLASLGRLHGATHRQSGQGHWQRPGMA
jgi:transcriptional regulator with XRE-family HTH domain